MGENKCLLKQFLKLIWTDIIHKLMVQFLSFVCGSIRLWGRSGADLHPDNWDLPRSDIGVIWGWWRALIWGLPHLVLSCYHVKVVQLCYNHWQEISSDFTAFGHLQFEEGTSRWGQNEETLTPELFWQSITWLIVALTLWFHPWTVTLCQRTQVNTRPGNSGQTGWAWPEHFCGQKHASCSVWRVQPGQTATETWGATEAPSRLGVTLLGPVCLIMCAEWKQQTARLPTPPTHTYTLART